MKVQNSDAMNFQARMIISVPEKASKYKVLKLNRVAKNFEEKTKNFPNDTVNLTLLKKTKLSSYKIALSDSLTNSVILNQYNFEDANSVSSLTDTFVTTYNALKTNSEYFEKLRLLTEDKNKLKNIAKDETAFYVNKKNNESKLEYFPKVKEIAETFLSELDYKIAETLNKRKEDLTKLSTNKLDFVDLFNYSVK